MRAAVGHDGGSTQGLADGELATIAGTSDQRYVWARMTRKGIPHLEAYHQDLIWDWVCLRQYWDPEGFTFYWGVREYGTSIDRDEATFRSSVSIMGYKAAWKVTVTFYDSGDFRDMTWEDWTP